MTTRYKSGDNLGVPSGYSEKDIPDDFKVPSCTIEDVDYALFSLFDKELNLSVKDSTTGKHKKLPVIFSSGERWALVKNNKLLRDRSGAIILPIITIQRSSISQTNDDITGRGINQNVGQLVIYKKLSKEDSTYQNILNKQNIPNQFLSDNERNIKLTLDENLLTKNLNNNIYEVITIPTPQFYTIKYTVTVWTQYLQQLNNIIEQLISAYLPVGMRTYKIQTKKGYWFLAKVDENFKDETNFTDMSDNERIVKSSFEITVPAYFIPGNDIPGIENPVRRFISAPKISFTVGDYNEIDINDFPIDISKNKINDDSTDLTLNTPETGYVDSFDNTTKGMYSIKYIKNPLTNINKPEYIKVVSRDSKTGETVYIDDGSMKIKTLK
jgi:hypothetical protein